MNILGAVSRTFRGNTQWYINMSSPRTLSIKVIMGKYMVDDLQKLIWGMHATIYFIELRTVFYRSIIENLDEVAVCMVDKPSKESLLGEAAFVFNTNPLGAPMVVVE
jgi:hypothetical protein